ncbi:uncharacterized protein STEHIDRAFT_138992 [Stereum hirsutum FP-91666 SS1]|uniref:uncharacterized protein n=1 Tax=Stereum hirsutum (strain FP-91666) TaxID=721885 RepID=UPI000440FA15|nr:uncharacterized protein STEHIDRAFT_138992 [Stereum hirsutum FP-91666 SS1]EIM87202.1 hypothetical protein STEHIDRAFT_138992 [Stereum hirsutum FP-91666 SS1]
MAAANNFGIFMNAVTLLDFTYEILGYVRPQAQMQKLEVALRDVRDELEEAIRKDVDIQSLESRLARCRDQYRTIHLCVNAETALHLEVWDVGKGLTWEMYRLAEELKVLRRDIMVAIRDTQSSARIVPTLLAPIFLAPILLAPTLLAQQITHSLAPA